MLEAKNLTASYGHHRALDGVSAHVEPREICVVLGANGAGKTTLLKAIGGIVPVNGVTEIVMNGRRLNGLRAHEIVEAGIALVPEGRGIFADLTVDENLQLGAYAARARAHEKRNREMVFDLFPRLAERRRQQARTMSGGEQQMVAIGRALMSDPEILMLDEPSLGLSPLLCGELFRSLKEIGGTGVGILLVEQNAKQSLAIADRGYLLENGHITGEDSASNLASDPAVRRAYLGGPAETPPAGAAGRHAPAPSFSQADEEMARGLAARAAFVANAHIAQRRSIGRVPSAFRKSSENAMSATQNTARITLRGNESAEELGRLAGDLAREAGAVLAAHIAARRARTLPRKMTTPNGAAPGAAELAAMAGDLADEAAAIHARHIAERGRALGMAKKISAAKAPPCEKDDSKICICAKSGDKAFKGVKCQYKKKKKKKAARVKKAAG
jgi:branched-chain amino acid transport system ATP-binding protein